MIRCIAASVALSPSPVGYRSSPWDCPASCIDAAGAAVEQAATLDAALELAAASLGSTRAMARGTSTFALRTQGLGVEGWEPAVVIAADGAGDALDAAHDAAGDGLAVVVAERVGAGRVAHRAGRRSSRPAAAGRADHTVRAQRRRARATSTPCSHTAETPLELRPRLVALPSVVDRDGVVAESESESGADPIGALVLDAAADPADRRRDRTAVVAARPPVRSGRGRRRRRHGRRVRTVQGARARRVDVAAPPPADAHRRANGAVGRRCPRRDVRQRRQRRPAGDGPRRATAGGRGVAGPDAHRGPAAPRRRRHRRRPARGAPRRGPRPTVASSARPPPARCRAAHRRCRSPAPRTCGPTPRASAPR